MLNLIIEKFWINYQDSKWLKVLTKQFRCSVLHKSRASTCSMKIPSARLLYNDLSTHRGAFFQFIFWWIPYCHSKCSFFSVSAMCFLNLQTKVFQKAILNLKFRFPCNNSKVLLAWHLNFKLRIIFWNIFFGDLEM